MSAPFDGADPSADETVEKQSRAVRRAATKASAKQAQRTRRLAGPGLSPAERLALGALVGAAPRDDGSTHHGMIDDRLIEGMCDLLDRTDVIELTGKWHAERRLGRGLGGRPRVYDQADRMILVLMLSLLSASKAPQLKEVANAVHHRLSAESRERLGLASDNAGASERAIYGRIHRAWKSFTDLCDPLPGINHRRRSRAEVEAIRITRDPEQVRLKSLRAERILNTIVRMPLVLLEPETIAEWGGDITLDATDCAVWGKGGHKGRAEAPKPTDMMSPEFEAGRYHHHNGDLVHAYATHIALMAPKPLEPGKHPILALAMSMDLPGSRNGQNAIALLRSVRDAGLGVEPGYLVADRAYPGSKVEDFTRPAKAMGYTPVIEYTRTQINIRAYQGGAVWAEGNWFCPGTPQMLLDATKTFMASENKKADFSTWVERMELRAGLTFTTKGGENDEVKRCPAQGPAPSAICAHRPQSAKVGLGMPGRVKVSVWEPPTEPDRACTNKSSITLRNDVDDQVEKLSQDLPFGTRKWHAVYKPLRAVMEGFNGFAKDETKESLSVSAHRRVRGFFANAFITAIALAVANIRKIKAWRKAGEPPGMKANEWLDPEHYKDKRAEQPLVQQQAGAWWLDQPPEAAPAVS